MKKISALFLLIMVIIFAKNMTFSQDIPSEDKDFNAFWKEFKTSIEKGDMKSLSNLGEFPLKTDEGFEDIGKKNYVLESLTTKNIKKTIKKVKFLNRDVILEEESTYYGLYIKNEKDSDYEINYKLYKFTNKKDCSGSDCLGYYLFLNFPESEYMLSIIFEKVNGKYKMTRIGKCC